MCTSVTDRRQTTDGWATAYSEREHEFTFTKNEVFRISLLLKILFNYLVFGALNVSNKSSAVTEMGDRLATTDMGRKWGLLCPFSWVELGPHLTQCHLAEVYRPTKWHLDPFSRLAITDMGQKLGGCALLGKGSWVSI